MRADTVLVADVAVVDGRELDVELEEVEDGAVAEEEDEMEEDDAVVVSLDVEDEEDGSVATGLVRGVTGTLLLAVEADDDVDDMLLGVVNVLLSAGSLMCC